MERNEHKDKKGLRVWLFPIVFVTVVIGLMCCMIFSTFISQDRLTKHYLESANILCSRDVFFDEVENVDCSRIDRYADSILLNISWYFNRDLPLSSVMWDSYYYTSDQNENDNLRDAVQKNKEPNLQYMRYWHGSAAIVRLLHLILNIQQIYVLHTVLIFVLIILVTVMLLRKGMLPEAVVFLIGMVSVSVWFVPMSLEYGWTFICMLFTSCLVLWLQGKERDEALCMVFLLTGIVTNYLDFLTTETLTLSVPLLFAYRVRVKMVSGKERISKLPISDDKIRRKQANRDLCWIIRNCLLWGAGYIGMWVMKWMIASLVLHENVMPYVSEHVKERLDGGGDQIWLLKYMWMAVTKNIKCLFPYGYGVVGVYISIIAAFIILYFAYVYHREHPAWNRIIIYVVIGMIPVLRYMVLHNHAYIHYFFTYRALMASVMSCCFILLEIVDRRYLHNAYISRRRS